MESDGDVAQLVLEHTLQEVQREDDNVSSTEPDPCVICLESISEKAEAFPCRHANFDYLCLLSWLDTTPKCPLCKSIVSSVRFNSASQPEIQTYQVKQHVNSTNTGGPAPRPRGRYSLPRRRRQWRPDESPVFYDAALARRREIYQQQLYSLHVGSNTTSGFEDLTPRSISQDEETVSKARAWIRRELRVFEFLADLGSEDSALVKRPVNAEYLLHFIVAILKTIDLKGSRGQAEDMIQDFLGRQNTRIFIHELISWLRSPYTSLDAWDRHTQYATANMAPVMSHQH